MSAWWDAQTGGLVGAVLGGGLGTLGGLLGAAMGVMAPRGRYRRLLLGAQVGLVVLGVVILGAGVAAAATGQPFHVYYPLLLTGVVMSAVMGGLLPVTRAQYRRAEQRKLDAEALRDG